MPHAFDRRLAAGPLLCDGAMGTLLYARGVSIDACFDVLNVNQAKVVQSVHSEYIAAGADCIETNTFGANRFKLAVHGLAGDVHQINLPGRRRAARRRRPSDGCASWAVGPSAPTARSDRARSTRSWRRWDRKPATCHSPSSRTPACLIASASGSCICLHPATWPTTPAG